METHKQIVYTFINKLCTLSSTNCVHFHQQIILFTGFSLDTDKQQQEIICIQMKFVSSEVILP